MTALYRPADFGREDSVQLFLFFCTTSFLKSNLKQVKNKFSMFKFLSFAIIWPIM